MKKLKIDIKYWDSINNVISEYNNNHPNIKSDYKSDMNIVTRHLSEKLDRVAPCLSLPKRALEITDDELAILILIIEHFRSDDTTELLNYLKQL